jgi:capsular exopolysaccharide synthesis family protein
MPEIVPYQRGVVQVGPPLVPAPDAPDPFGTAEPSGGLQLKASLALIWRHRWMVLAAGVLGLAAAAYLVSQEPPRFESSAVIRLSDPRRGMVPGENLTPALGGNRVDPLLSQLEIMRSRSVMDEAVDLQGLRLRAETPGFPAGVLTGVHVDSTAAPDTLNLRLERTGFTVRGAGAAVPGVYGLPVQVGGVRFTLARYPGMDAAVLRVLPRMAAVGVLQRGLSAQPRVQTDIVDVRFTAPDPAVAQRSLQAVLRAFQETGARRARQESHRRRVFIEEQLARTDSAVREAQSALVAFRQSQGVTSSAEQATAQQAGMFALQTRREELVAQRRQYETLLGQYRAARPPERPERLRALVSAPGIAQNPVVANEYAVLSRYEAARDSMAAGEFRATESNPDLARLNTLIAAGEQRIVNAVASQLGMLDAQLQSLTESAARSAGQIQSLPGSQAQEVRLAQEVGSLQLAAEALRSEYQRAQISEAVEAGQVEIVDPASLPLGPQPASRPLKLLLGLALGLMLGSGAALLRESMNTSVRRHDELEGLLQVPALVVIPRIASEGHAARTGLRRLLPAFGNGNGNGANGASGAVPPAAQVLAVAEGHSTAAEAYRTLRTNLIFSQTGRALRSIIITSASPGEGKSTTSSNLAAAFAQQGMRVLLVDSDLRRPTLHTIFGTPREPGLTQVLVGQKALADVVQASSVPGLSLLTAGVLPPNPAELLGSPVMRDLLRTMGESYDMVILDTPPVMAASDSSVLASMVDGVVLVVRAGRTERSMAQQAVRQLTSVGARVLGAALNDPDRAVAAYGGAGYYYYAYNYYGPKE